MLLIIEIALTITAWKRGWKGYALLPIGIGICLGIALGGVAGSGTSPDTLFILGVSIDVAMIGLLSLMIAMRKPEDVQAKVGAKVVASAAARPTTSPTTLNTGRGSVASIAVQCANCARDFLFPASMAGHRKACSGCNSPFQIG